jgi:hypothetical protein
MSLKDAIARLGGGEKSPAVPVGEQAPVADNRNPARDAARADVVAEVKKRRGRPRLDGSSGAGAGTPSADDLALQKIQQGLDELFRPEAWEPIMALPGDAMLAFTGREHWNISREERKTLGTTASTAARFMAIQNPKYLALSLCATAILTVYGSRIVKDLALRKIEKEKAAKVKSEP